jgi:hypothetical protein
LAVLWAVLAAFLLGIGVLTASGAAASPAGGAAGGRRVPVTGGHAGPGAPAAALQWLFAEGYTGPGFAEYLTVLNPGPRPAHLTIGYPGAASPPSLRTVDPLDRLTVRVSAAVPAGREHGIVVGADQPVVAERSLYFSAGVGDAGRVDGGHSGFGATAPSARWLFAEGYTGPGFQEYITILNPDVTETAHIVVAMGSTRVEREVGPQARATLDVNAAAGRGSEVAAEVTSDRPVVAERPIYFAAPVGSAGAVDGGHVVLGATAPATTALFADGFTGAGFQTYLAIVNPGHTPATATASAWVDAIDRRSLAVSVAAHGRTTVDLNEMVGPGREVALAVEAPTGLVVERVVYFRRTIGAAGPVDGGDAARGTPEAATTWSFAEGHTGGAFQEYLVILDPGEAEAVVPIEIVFPSGPPAALTITIPGGTRRTIDVRSAAGQARDAAMVVGPASVPVVAERPVYFTTSVEVARE